MVRFTSFVVVCSLYWVVGAGGLARAANLSLEDVIERASVEALAVKRAEVEVMMAQIRADSNYSVYLPHLASRGFCRKQRHLAHFGGNLVYQIRQL